MKVIHLLILFLLTLAVGGSGYLIWQQKNTSKLKHAKGHHHPDVIVTSMNSIRTDKKGNIQYRLYSPIVKHFPNDNSTEYKAPHLTVYKEKPAPPWHIHSNFARSDSKFQKIMMRGNVRLDQARGKNNDSSHVRTSLIYIYPPLKRAQTDKPVTLWQPSMVTTGVGLIANWGKDWIKLFHHVKTEYTEMPKRKPVIQQEGGTHDQRH